jgi:hypothetical protein
MSKEIKTPTFEINKHISDVIFEKKEDSTETKIITIEEQMVNYSNEVLGIKVKSVALPLNHSPETKTESQVIHWLRDRIHSRYSTAYELALKYGEKLKVKLDKK